jgi:glycosyltransferase involved in cell wall biosynthesis
MEPRKVIFVNRYFHPDHSATSQMVSDLAFALSQRGWDVEVITSRQRYDDASAALAARETIEGVRVIRVATSRFGRALLAGRAIDYATFYVTAFLALLSRLHRGTIVIAKTDPPLISFVAALASIIRRATLVNWTQDLFPDVAEALGVVRRGGVIARLAGRMRDVSLRRARMNVAIGERMADRIRAAGGAVTVQQNWAGSELQPVPRAGNELRRAWQAGERVIVAYSGNLGRAHEVETLAAAMHALAADDTIRFVIIGGGARLSSLRALTRGLTNVEFLPYQPRELLSQSLSAADVHLISLQPSLEGLIVPSKFYGIAAVGRPSIFIGARDGELGQIIEREHCGIVVDPGNDAALIAAIRRLARDSNEREAMGARALSLHRRELEAHLAFDNWERILTTLDARPR